LSHPVDVMSAKWSIQRNEAEVVHSTEHLGHRIEVRNYPESNATPIDGIVFNRFGEVWSRVTWDNPVATVRDAKALCLAWIDERIK
jgi:hypothetical protein